MQINTRKLKKVILKALPYAIFAYAGNLIGYAYRTAEGNGFQEKILPFMSNLGVAFAKVFPSFHPLDILFGLILAGVMRLVLYIKSKNKKKFRQGEEYGSAVWGGEKDIEPYMDLSNPENNVILTKTESLTMGKPSTPKYARNKNILVIGGSGSGKTRFFVKPNLMQMHSSYVITDPKGTVLVECGHLLARGRQLRNSEGRIVYQRDGKNGLKKDKNGKPMLGDELSALFVIISDTDATFNFLVAIMYSQLFNLLCTKADNSDGGRLQYHVRCLLDEFANIGEIPQFEKLIATIRSREISASIILQAKSQLKAIYKDNADTIEGNCDTMLFLGGKEKSTLKEISESLGKETIDSFNTSTNRGQSESYGMNYQKLGKELKSQDELAVMDGGKCILQLRGVRPFFSDKYDITRHKNYSELLDADPKKKFDIQSFVSDRSGMVSNISPKDQISQWVIDKSSSALKEVTYPADATERENAEAEAVYDADSETDIDGDTADS